MGKRKSMKGGSLINQSNSIVNILLVLLVGIIAYNLLNQPQVIIQEKPKVIIKEIVKEEEEDEEPYREDLYRPDRKRRINKPFYPTRRAPEVMIIGFLQDSDDPDVNYNNYMVEDYPNSTMELFRKVRSYHHTYTGNLRW